jgi:hypothetical protein
MRQLFIRIRMPLLLFIFVFAVCWKIFLSHEYTILAFPDSSRQSYPWFQYMAHCLHQGIFPYWDYTTDGGRTFIGEIQTGVFYPLNMLLALLPLNHSGLLSSSLIERFVALHLFLAGLGIYFLGRHLRLSPFASFVAGVTYAFSGSLASRSFGQINVFFGAVWIPWVFYFALRAFQSSQWMKILLYSNVAGLFLALTLLGGHHQPFYYASLALAISVAWWFYSVRKKPPKENVIPFTSVKIIAVTLALIFIFAVGYSAVQLFPSLEYAKMALRWYGEGCVPANKVIPYSNAGESCNLNPGGVFLFIFPYLGSAENSPYFGIIPLVFAIFAAARIRQNPHVRWLLILAGVFFILALGGSTPIHGLAYFLVPGMDKAREAVRALLISHFCFSLLAGFGIDCFVKPISIRWKTFCFKYAKTVLGVAVFFTIVTYVCYFYRSRVLYQDTNYDGIFVSCFLLLAAAGIMIFRNYHLASMRTLKVVIVLVLLTDFYYYLQPGFQIKNKFDRAGNLAPQKFYAKDKILNFLGGQASPFRIDFRNDLYPPNIGEVLRLETINGYGATSYQPYLDILSIDYTAGGKVHDMLNVKYVVTTQELPLPKVMEDGNRKVFQNPDPLPRTWLVHNIRINSENNPIGTMITDPAFDPKQSALLPGNVMAPSSWNREGQSFQSTGPLSPLEEVEYQRINPRQVRVQIRNSTPGLLVLSETWYPGWRIRINGQEVPLLRVNGCMRGAFTPGGNATVDFDYRPTHMTFALVLLGICFAVLIASIWAVQRKTATSVYT